MNLAFYIDKLGQDNLNEKIFECLNSAVKNNTVSDASLFYNDIDYNPYQSNFGMFNSTDIWNYTGVLVATTIDNAMFANRVINKFKLYFLYRKNQRSNLLYLLQISKNIAMICIDEESKQELKRLTDIDAKLINNFSAEEFLELKYASN